MKYMVVGNGAREHAIVKAISESPKEPELHAFMKAKNPGIARLVKKIKLGDILSPGQVCDYATENKINTAVVGPEAPLAAGVTDALEEAGVLCVGARREAARLETDKTFMRDLLEKYGVDGNIRYGVFTDYADAEKHIDALDYEVAVKPAGLTGGKGVKIMGEHLKGKDEVKHYVKEVLAGNVDDLGSVVLEEKLVGEEFTLQAFVDGTTVVGTPMVQDHKRAYDGDTGPNTGGMGSYSDAGYILPFLTQDDYDAGIKIMTATIKAVKKETGVAYKGFLYGQFMATRDGLKVIEFNARLGDPEAMNTLAILETDFTDVCDKIAGGMLSGKLEFKKAATVTKYMCPEGYPTNPKTNVEVAVDEKSIRNVGGLLYYASVRKEGRKILTSSSRAIAVTGVAKSITEAEAVVESSMRYIQGDLFYRKDIGTRPLVQKRIDHMAKIRGD